MRLLRLSDKRPDAQIDQAIADAIKDASETWRPLQFEGEFPKNGFGIQTLRPWHLFYDHSSRTMTGTYAATTGAIWGFSYAAASTWYSSINNVTTSERAYLVLEGVFSRAADPQVTEIQFVINSEEHPVLNIEEMYTFDLAEAWFSKPVWLKPQTNLTIRSIANNAVTYEQLGFLGRTIAKKPYLVSRTPVT